MDFFKLIQNFINHNSPLGPADVPLMSPSGTLPPIYLPPGYMSQVYYCGFLWYLTLSHHLRARFTLQYDKRTSRIPFIYSLYCYHEC